MGLVDDAIQFLTAGPTSRSAAVRIIPDGEVSPPPAPVTPQGQKTKTYDPHEIGNRLLGAASGRLRDPISTAILGKWRNVQQRGRTQYDVMLAHPVVAAAFNERIRLLSSQKPTYKPRAQKPSARQKEMAAFANHIVDNLDKNVLFNGVIHNALAYGFSLSEIVTKTAMWNGKKVVDLDTLVVLPQASLDNGFTAREEFGPLSIGYDNHYRCFDIDDRGRISAVHQYRHGSKDRDTITWQGDDLQYILHVKNKGGDGNPFGESALYSTYFPWSDLHILEQIEANFLDTALPFLLFTYATENKSGMTRPVVHDKILEAVTDQGPSVTNRVIVGADLDGKSVAPGNENFTEHARQVKAEKKEQIWQTMLIPKSLVSETEETDGDSRNLVQVYFKYGIRADLAIVESALNPLISRLLHANYGHVDPEDLPEPVWNIITENEVRVLQNFLPLVINHLDADEGLRAFFTTYMTGFDPEWIAATHADSVAIKRPAKSPDVSPNNPPPKQPGENRQRTDGATDNPARNNTDA